MESLTRKIHKVTTSGPSKLMVFADFDMTLTSFCVNGREGCTSYGVIENSSRMPESFREEILQVKNRYYPIEVAKDMSLEQRTQAMVDWWKTSNDLMVKYGVRKSDIKEMVAEANLALRPKTREVFSLLEQHSIPLYVLSAGLADVIHEVFLQQSRLWTNMHIISNSLLCDERGVAIGFSEPLIHTFNKHHVTEFFKEDFKETVHRANVLLLGDSQGDPSMTDGINGTNSHSIIKIGFLNHHEDELLSRYMELYDVVLTGDGDMAFVHTMLQALLQHSTTA
eukprot:Em0012g855a